MRVQSPPVRSIRRLAECVRSGSLDSLPRSSRGCGLCWLAVGLEPETYEAPQLLEVLKKLEEKMEEKKEVASERPAETAPAAVPAVETKLAMASDCKDEEKPTELAEKQEKAAAQPEVETPQQKTQAVATCC